MDVDVRGQRFDGTTGQRWCSRPPQHERCVAQRFACVERFVRIELVDEHDVVVLATGFEQHQRAGFAREGADTRAFAAERGELLRDELRCHVIPNDLGIGRDQHQSKRTRLSYQKSVEWISMKFGKFCNTKGVNMLDGQRTGA